jgi:MoaA/NifB/PqqE/SkfB family radical SAM enzyme
MSNIQYPLKNLFWECTLRCNAFCAFCGSACGEVQSQELTTEEISSAFRDIADKMDTKTIMINVTGGEPLLRKD